MQLKLQDVDYIRSAGQTGAGPRAAGAWPGHFKRFTTTSLSCPGKLRIHLKKYTKIVN